MILLLLQTCIIQLNMDPVLVQAEPTEQPQDAQDDIGEDPDAEDPEAEGAEDEAFSDEQAAQKMEEIQTNEIVRWPQGPAVSAEHL